MRCAVGNCKQSNSKKSTSGNTVHFYSFPKDAAQRQLWVNFCNRVNTINVQNERICSLHFKEEDLVRNLKFEMGFSNRCTPKLKSGALPTVCSSSAIADVVKPHSCKEEITTPMVIDTIKKESEIMSGDEQHIPMTTDAIKKKIETFTCTAKHIPTTTADTDQDSGLQLHIRTLEAEMNALRQENNKLKKLQNQSTIAIKKLLRQVQSLSFTNANLEKALGRLFTEGQMKKLKNGDKRQIFTQADIAHSITLYSTSAKAYRLLKNKHFPLPSVRTVQRWSQKLNEPTVSLEPIERI